MDRVRQGFRVSHQGSECVGLVIPLRRRLGEGGSEEMHHGSDRAGLASEAALHSPVRSHYPNSEDLTRATAVRGNYPRQAG
jgi:hypothetical protein